ncbi:antibiotic biosynthesis monooxygenase [Halomonas sp. PA5]|nr:antibiotic biosynthesis monooxygenase [Halomonas sp. PA5]
MVARRVARGRYRAFHEWLDEGRHLAADFHGYLGSGVLAPPPGEDEHQIIFRFTDEATLAAWEHSASRRAWLARGQGLYAEPSEHRASGIDSWFRDAAGNTPPRWKQAVAVWLAFFPVSLMFQWLFGGVLSSWPLVPKVLISTLILTPIMVFYFIPLSTRLLAPWLQGQTSVLERLGRLLHHRRA